MQGKLKNRSLIEIIRCFVSSVCIRYSDDCFAVLHYCLRSLIEVRHPDDAPEPLRKEVHDKYALYIAILENQEGHLVEMVSSKQPPICCCARASTSSKCHCTSDPTLTKRYIRAPIGYEDFL